MSDLDDWKARQASSNVPTVGNGELFIRCGRGRRGQRCSWSGAPPDSVLASEWERLAEAALAAEHVQLTASDLDGRMVGEAFLEHLIRDPKVLAAGKWLCLERPKLNTIFAEGKFPGVAHDSPRQRGPIRSSHRPPYANVSYADLKERLRGLPSGTLSNSDRPLATFPAPRPSSSLVWDAKWPLVLDSNKLTGIFTSQYDLDANYQDDPFEGPIYHTAKALADRHQTFFKLLRAHLLVAEGTFKDSGQELPVPYKQWSREDRYLDVLSSDLFDKEDGKGATAMWESVILRIPSQEEMSKPRRPRPAEKALAAELKKRGLADGRHGRTDSELPMTS